MSSNRTSTLLWVGSDYPCQIIPVFDGFKSRHYPMRADALLDLRLLINKKKDNKKIDQAIYLRAHIRMSRIRDFLVIFTTITLPCHKYQRSSDAFCARLSAAADLISFIASILRALTFSY